MGLTWISNSENTLCNEQTLTFKCRSCKAAAYVKFENDEIMPTKRGKASSPSKRKAVAVSFDEDDGSFD